MKKAVSFFLVLLIFMTFSSQSRAATVVVDMKDFFFDPGVINVNVGDTVTWQNAGTSAYTTTSGSSCTSDGKWDSGLLLPGQQFQRVFDQAGTYPYFSIPHCAIQGMVGTVVAGATPTNVTTTIKQWNGTVSFPIKTTSTVTDSSGNQKFRTAAQLFSGTMGMITKDSNLLADQNGCFIVLSSNSGTSICIKDEAFIRTVVAKSKTDSFQLIGTGNFSQPISGGSQSGPVYLDSKGTLKKDSTGAVVSINLTGKVAGGIDDNFVFNGNVKSTMVPSGSPSGVTITTLLSGSQEVPAVTTSGNGVATFVINLSSGAISGSVTFSGLTSNAVASHIHQGAAGVNGPVIIPLQGGNGSTSGVWQVPDGTVLTQDQLNALEAGQLYVNIHSVNFPAGEIRGQIDLSND